MRELQKDRLTDSDFLGRVTSILRPTYFDSSCEFLPAAFVNAEEFAERKELSRISGQSPDSHDVSDVLQVTVICILSGEDISLQLSNTIAHESVSIELCLFSFKC